MKTIKLILPFFMICNLLYSQQSKFLEYLVDSLNDKSPMFVNLPVDSGFMAVERLAITKNGKQIFYGVRNGYDSTSVAQIQKIEFQKDKWGKPIVVFSNKAGAPSLADDDRTMFFQYDHPDSPKGVFSIKEAEKWTTPKIFIDSLAESHYLQKKTSGNFYYSAAVGNKLRQRDIYCVNPSTSDTSISRLGFYLKGGCCTDIFVSPDESYIVFTMNKDANKEIYNFYRKGGNGAELFISFKNNNNKWTDPLNLGKSINGLSDWNWGPFVTDDGKYLLFSSWTNQVGVYMIRFDKILEELKNKTQGG